MCSTLLKLLSWEKSLFHSKISTSFFDAALDPTSLSADFKHGILQDL